MNLYKRFISACTYKLRNGLAYYPSLVPAINGFDKKIASISVTSQTKTISLKSNIEIEPNKHKHFIDNTSHEKTPRAFKKEKNENSSDVIDSITYAREIQRAMLPDAEELNNAFNSCFVMHEAKDILSGDFYWVQRFDNKVLFSIGDCTGHGVPGSLLTMIGYTLLNEITYSGVYSPSVILKRMNAGFQKILKQSVKKEKINDGIDMIICLFDTQTNILEFSSANRPIVIIKEGKQIIIKGNKYGIGGDQTDEKRMYTTHTVELNTGDSFYLFTDGIIDQFGGEKGKKIKKKNFLDIIEQASQLPIYQQKEFIQEHFNLWKGTFDQTDDVLIMGVQIP